MTVAHYPLPYIWHRSYTVKWTTGSAGGRVHVHLYVCRGPYCAEVKHPTYCADVDITACSMLWFRYPTCTRQRERLVCSDWLRVRVKLWANLLMSIRVHSSGRRPFFPIFRNHSRRFETARTYISYKVTYRGSSRGARNRTPNRTKNTLVISVCETT